MLDRSVPAGMVSPLLEEFKTKLRANGRSDGTVDRYFYVARRFLIEADRLNAGCIADIKLEDWEAYVSRLNGLSGYAKHVYGAAFRSFMKLLGHSDWAKVPTISAPKAKVKALKQNDVVKLLMAAGDKRDMTMIYLAYSTGLRRSEIVNLNIGDVDFQERSIHVRLGKGDKERYVFFDESCEDFLRGYLATRGPVSPMDPLFTGRHGNRLGAKRLGRMVRITALKAGLITPSERRKVTLHKLRHTFATTMLDQVGIFRLKELLGHESIATTERYLHADLEDLRRAYERGARALALRMDGVTERVP